ncbi:MAG: site-specific integrase, partial [Methanosphaera sp.]|nr:site-specific integrase [Methanosphaera sp.]
FAELNDMLNLGKVGEHRRLRSHMLRKFHASYLLNAGMSKDDVNSLQGKTQNSTDESYFYNDPKKLQKKYIKYMGAITINLDVNNLEIKSPEYVELENKNKELQRKYDENIKALWSELDNMKIRSNTWEKLQQGD